MYEGIRLLLLCPSSLVSRSNNLSQNWYISGLLSVGVGGGGGGLPTERLRPKGVPFSGWRYIKG